MLRKLGITLVLALGAALPAVAEERVKPAPYPEFTFKRVSAPRAGAKRITVQIDPVAQALALAVPKRGIEEPAAAVPAIPATPQPSGYDWYWALVSPALDQTGPLRTSAALASLAGAPDGKSVPAPRLQHLHDIADAHGVEILTATLGTNVSPALVLAVIGVESSGRSDALSHAGAQGLMQLMPDTAARFGVTDANDAAQNIRGGVAYLDWLLKKFDGDPVLALAGYNAGENAVTTHAGVPPYAETRAYVPKVLAAWQVVRGLCKTPPELISDGCVFTPKKAPKNG